MAHDQDAMAMFETFLDNGSARFRTAREFLLGARRFAKRKPWKPGLERDPVPSIEPGAVFDAVTGHAGRGSLGAEVRRRTRDEALEAIAADCTVGRAARGRMAAGMMFSRRQNPCSETGLIIADAYTAGAIGPERLSVLIRRHPGGVLSRPPWYSWAESDHRPPIVARTILKRVQDHPYLTGPMILSLRSELDEAPSDTEWLRQAMSPRRRWDDQVSLLCSKDDARALLFMKEVPLYFRMDVLCLGPFHPAFLRYEDLLDLLDDARRLGMPWVHLDPTGAIPEVVGGDGAPVSHFCPSRNPILSRFLGGHIGEEDVEALFRAYGGRIPAWADVSDFPARLQAYGSMISKEVYERAWDAGSSLVRKSLEISVRPLVRSEEEIEAAYGPGWVHAPATLKALHP